MIITGTLPLILYNEIEDKENVIGKGTDIDITLREQGKETYISATTLGNGKWEIEELDDNANLLPEYDVGDVISFDVLKKILVTRKEVLTSSYQIFSFNLLGKVKYGLQDAEKDFKKKLNRKTDKAKGVFKGIKDWFTDDLDKETAQAYIRKYYQGANVGEIEKINDIDGATFKVLFGVPSEEKFYVGCLHRNGNDIRFLDDDDSPDTPLYSFTDAEEADTAFDNYPKLEGTDEDPDNPESSEDNSENTETEITEETLEEALKGTYYEGFAVVDFEQCEDVTQNNTKILAVAILSQSEPDIKIAAANFANIDGKLTVANSNEYTIYSPDEIESRLKKAIEDYKKLGGKKDLSYLLEKNKQEDNSNKLGEEQQVTQPGTSGESDGVQWEVTQSFKRFIKSNLDQSELLSKENEILDDCFNECEFTKSNMGISDDVCLDRFASKVFRIHGGLNGSGNWSDYFEELQRLVDILNGKLNEQFENGCEVYLINLIVDVPDDVWDAVFGISVDKKYDETKIDSEKYTGEDEDIDFNYNKETDEWYPYLIPSSIAKKRKKSKYNGKNVTGYQDGMLGEMSVASHKLFSRCLSRTSFENQIYNFIASALNLNELKESGDYSVIIDKLKPALKQVNAEYANEARRIAGMWTRANSIDEFIDIMKTPTVEIIGRKGFVKLCCDNPKIMKKLILFLNKISPK